ncbi:MAG: NF038122 family metalloprotease [Parasphingorhabdus sp.]|uniref:NF038122 family metalloprotease n=1 Tax=Parasphingorhabdus sp. TaxID=2709688 RepID=UPI0032969A98
MNKTKLLMAGAAIAAMPLSTAPANALTIVLENLGGAESNTRAFAGFTAAARFWESILTNDATVRVSVGFSALDPGVLAQAGSSSAGVLVEDFVTALRATGTTNLDSQAVTPNLVASQFDNDDGTDILGFNALISAPNENGGGVATPLTRTLDADGSANNVVLDANRSNLKAVGLLADDGASDAAITFSNQFAFDFDPTDGISAGAFDFVGIAIHEIGHALGFVSGVDTYDFVGGNPDIPFGDGTFADLDLNPFRIFSPLDLFRYSDLSAQLGVIDVAVGGVDGEAPFFSIDGGATNLFGDAFFSTGSFLGDGRQASHWRDVAAGEVQRGILDPTLSRGTNSIITGLDLAAFDAIGWNLDFDVLADPNLGFSTTGINVSAVPEPATWGMMIFGFGMIGGALRRRKTVKAKPAFA